ncbi:hypothetical protein [Intestinibacter bartlettii]|uniref:hypothetical protein n=1 Tax=Intestinibacter bartlettii TaxID=261299 RepID=UPI003995AB0D
MLFTYILKRGALGAPFLIGERVGWRFKIGKYVNKIDKIDKIDQIGEQMFR